MANTETDPAGTYGYFYGEGDQRIYGTCEEAKLNDFGRPVLLVSRHDTGCLAVVNPAGWVIVD